MTTPLDALPELPEAFDTIMGLQGDGDEAEPVEWPVFTADQMRDYAHAALASKQAPPGFWLAPDEPSEAMLLAGGRSLIDGVEVRQLSLAEESGLAYAAMRAAHLAAMSAATQGETKA